MYEIVVDELFVHFFSYFLILIFFVTALCNAFFVTCNTMFKSHERNEYFYIGFGDFVLS